MRKRSFGWITIKIYNEIKGLKVPTYDLSLDEINKLWHELRVYEICHPRSLYVVNAIRLLMLTGARLREIINLTWREVDLDKKLIVLNERKTAKKYIYLSD